MSDPESANYGKHWQPKEIAAFFAPSSATIDAVQSWLVGEGFAPHRLRLTGGNQWMTVNMTVTEAESILNTKYELYSHRTGALRPGSSSRQLFDCSYSPR